MTSETLNQEKRKAENARHWVAASAESQSPSERGSVRPNEAVRPAENQRMGGDPLRVKALHSWVKGLGPNRRAGLILAVLLIGVPVALLFLEPLLTAVATVFLGIVMLRGLLLSANAPGRVIITGDERDDTD